MARSGFTHGYWIKNAPSRLILRSIGLVAATIMVVIAIVSDVRGQTLTDPKFQTKISSPHVTAKSLLPGRMKSCKLYGAGFVNVPGTDACIKIGGYVTVEGTAKPGR